MVFLSYLGDLFTRLGVWIFLATFLAAYSHTQMKAAVHTFLFFIGMLISYYLYTLYLYGVFPTGYFMFWGSIALLSPLLAVIVWRAKNSRTFSLILPALPLGLMLSLSLGAGLFYLDIHYIEEFFMFIVLCAIFYRNPKQLAILMISSFVFALFIDAVSPFHF
ncbi:hypothetical protein GJU40_16865 [Bacillus lacus]|uniref:Uncharacterized protein n=2 Tax=Metabacillus lacus TaxID=1983721 RepID=A0A7X2J1N7_9BACI|nr:hypothetical protein [Metabacillus lacus]